MSNQKNPEHDDNEQPSIEVLSAPSASENTVTLKRPRSGSVVIFAPAGSAIMSIGTEDYLKVVLWPAINE